MDSNSPFVRSCYRKCCLWGRRHTIEHSKPYEGGPTPLFRSPQRTFYQVFTIINLLIFIVLIISYIVQFKVNKSVDLSCVEIDSIYITVLVFTGINAIWYVFLSRIEFASDQEWHKYMLFMGIDTVAQLTSVIATMYFTA